MNAPLPVNFDALLAAGVNDQPCRYDDRDAMLYAFGVGFGRGIGDPRELDFIHEGRGLRTVPTMAGLLVPLDFLADSGWDAGRVTIAEQRLELFRPLPPKAELKADSRVVAVLDHGRELGVSILVESEARMARDDTVLFNLASTLLTDGGAGARGPEGSGPLPHKLPTRQPDLSCDLKSFTDLPLLFRLCGDRRSGRPGDDAARPQTVGPSPLQPQCAAGMACRAILHTICEYDFTLISGFDLRFAGALYSGEVLTTEMWQERNIVSFRSVVRDRDAVVIDNGKCTLAV